MTDILFEELRFWMEAITYTLYVLFCKQNKITSTLILQSFSVELPFSQRLAEMLDNISKAVTLSGLREVKGYLKDPSPAQSFPMGLHAASRISHCTDSAVFPGSLLWECVEYLTFSFFARSHQTMTT